MASRSTGVGQQRPTRRRSRLVSVLALLVVVLTSSAGGLGAGAWRNAVREQAAKEFHTQADTVQAKLQAHLDSTNEVFSLAAKAVRAGQPLHSTLQSHDFIREFPGIPAIAHLTQRPGQPVQVADDWSSVASFGLVDLRFKEMLGPQLLEAVDASSVRGRPTASARYDFSWFSSRKEPTFFLAEPVTTPSAKNGQHDWLAIMVYGNWMVQDALQAAGSSFRVQILEGSTEISGDYLPIGVNASKPPAPIPAKATRLVTPLDAYGRPWRLIVADADGRTTAHISNQPTLLFLGVTLIGLLSGMLIWVLGRSRGRALQMVDEATEELRESQGLLRGSEERFRSIVQYASDAILLMDGQGVITYQSDSADHLFGYGSDTLLGQQVLGLIHHEDVESLAVLLGTGRAADRTRLLRCRLRTADGTWRQTETVVADLRDDPNVHSIVVTVRDISERQVLEEQLRHQAFHDSLTGLANRALFSDRVSHSLLQRPTRDGGVAVLLCDLDDFKTVNDSLGHAAGDLLLNEVARRLADSVRGGDTVARLGGDEFAILLQAPAGEQEATQVAERVLASLKAPVRLEDRDVVVGASVGIAAEPLEGIDADALIRNADVAMYLAKAEGKNRSAVFRPAMHEEVVARLAMRADLDLAIARDEFVLHYQPVVDLKSGAVTGVEALLRWQHPQHGLVMPGEFIPIAEESGQIVEIGRRTLLQACSQVALWQSAHPLRPPLRLNFNLSVRQLVDPDLIVDVRNALIGSGLPASSLTLEITESMLMRDLEAAAEQLARLKQLGVTLAIDDFGTGYSSLGYLQHLPVDTVKIDRSFIQALGSDDADPALVRAVVDLAGSLGLDTVAEGIEEGQQLALLRDLACSHGQGYLFAKPLSPAGLDELLTEAASTVSAAEAVQEHAVNG